MSPISPRRSPRRPPRSPMAPPKTPPNWKKPDEVMKLHRLRHKRTALLTRIDKCVAPKPAPSLSPPGSAKRKNPFSRKSDPKSRTPSPKKRKPQTREEANDESLFQLLGLNATETTRDLSFLNVSAPVIPTEPEEEKTTPSISLPVDWTVRTKMKFYSTKEFPWGKLLKMCEEASGVTGFVRCLETPIGKLDSPASANFHQSCLYWQHPNLSWLDLFPRSKPKKIDPNNVPNIINYPQMKENLHVAWTESFRSLVQLVRAKQCPYFYLMANSMNGVFRAAGVNGCKEPTAVLSPTNTGFRKLLKQEDFDQEAPKLLCMAGASVNFTAFLPKPNVTYEISLGIPLGENIAPQNTHITTKCVQFSMPLKVVKEKSKEEEEDDEETSAFLDRLGVNQRDMKKIVDFQIRYAARAEAGIDGSDESLILVEGCEVQALFNSLINSKSIIATSGPLAGVPPTLLSPVGFWGGSLLSLTVRQSVVKVDNESFFSAELSGPILPHTVHNVCEMLQKTTDQFSVSFANVVPTKSFTIASVPKNDKALSQSPSKVGEASPSSDNVLIDCGLKSQVLNEICSENVKLFDSIKYSSGVFSCF